MLSSTEFIQHTEHECVFISPHLDDAMLSCSSLIQMLVKAGRNVTIITVFTEATNINSTDATWLIKKSGFTDSKQYFEVRRAEDTAVGLHLQSHMIHLGFTDALWRTKISIGSIGSMTAVIAPAMVFEYPNFKHIFSRYHRNRQLEQQVIDSINQTLSNHIGNKRTVFVPMGMGNHADHVLINRISHQLSGQLYFWSDYPYVATSPSAVPPHKNTVQLVYEKKADTSKETIARMYKSQYYSLFPDNIFPMHAEQYWSAL